jgi:hypothetical protein
MSKFQQSSIAADSAGPRSQWPVCKGRLSDLEDKESDLSEITTAAERFAMMWQLAQDAWAFRGEPIPDPEESRGICRVIRQHG